MEQTEPNKKINNSKPLKQIGRKNFKQDDKQKALANRMINPFF